MDIKELVGAVMKLLSSQGGGVGGGLAETAKQALKSLLASQLAPKQAGQMDRVEQQTATDADKKDLMGQLAGLFGQQPDMASKASDLLSPLMQSGVLDALGGKGGDGESPLGQIGGLLSGLFGGDKK